MAIDRLNKVFFGVFILAFFVLSCKKNEQKDQVSNTKIEKKISQKNPIDFVQNFYKSYLTDLNDSTTKCVFGDYLSEELIKAIERENSNIIIDGQDYEKFDLKTLKVVETNNKYVFRVSFLNINHQVKTDVEIQSVNNNYKIIKLTDVKSGIVYPSSKKLEDYEYYTLKYFVEPKRDPRTGVTFTVEDFDENYTVFKKSGYSGNFEYKCSKKLTKEGLEFYYQETLEGEEFNGNKKEPLIKIFKRNSAYYAVSSFIEDGKEVKLEEE